MEGLPGLKSLFTLDKNGAEEGIGGLFNSMVIPFYGAVAA